MAGCRFAREAGSYYEPLPWSECAKTKLMCLLDLEKDCQCYEERKKKVRVGND
ncbi:hypothetical protein LCGC14_0998600 [marine sediment metagenome]|uniref:Uncharacterized protein n=1 Tax=marine sediment metagenome TaxID=412755 RepID=A0A0F9N8D8_9ZZZZ